MDGAEKGLKEIMAENFPNLARDIQPRSKINRKQTNPKKSTDASQLN